jgi:ABC-type nitrate/sulfonate/bicarbonate transport system substrate-binding protein
MILANLVPVYPYLFMFASSVATVSDLKGKKVGVSKFGGSADIATRVGLRREGLDPAHDVTIVETGSATNRVAALRAGAIQAGASQPPESTTLQQQGFHVLFDLAKLKLPAANTVVATTGAYARSHKAVVQAYIDSLIQALAREHKDKAFTKQILTKWIKLTDQALLDDTSSFYLNEVFPTYPAPKPEQYADAVQVLQQTNAKLQGFNVSKALDPSFVKSASDRKVGG